jgi:hypothetical protein
MANDYQRTISHTGYLEPERAFLTCSKEGRRHPEPDSLEQRPALPPGFYGGFSSACLRATHPAKPEARLADVLRVLILAQR